MNTMTTNSAEVHNTLTMPALLLKLESAATALGALAIYIHLGGSALLFVLLILAPDLSMIGYARNVAIGAMVYNVVHTYALPIALALIAVAIGSTLARTRTSKGSIVSRPRK